jgi:putative heme-binding domain-containing protein
MISLPTKLVRAILVIALSLGGQYAAAAADDKPKPKKIVLIAGKKSHGPAGNGMHDYGWSVQLLKVMLDNSNVKDRVQVEIHLDGWPKDPRTLEDADTIMIISDGRDGNQFEEAPHLASEERVRFIDKQMKRGCGFLTFHFSTFAPEKYRDQVLDWCGGYFQWETDGKRQWYSAIQTLETEVQLGAADHPISRGLKPFKMREEFYYNLRFKPKDESLKPIWTVPALKGRDVDGRIVAWARQREDGGRGFGTSAGHFYDNWKHEHFRKMIINAIVWTAKLDVPDGGVKARFYTHEEIQKALDGGGEQSIRVLILAGNEAHKWHNWERTTPALKALLERDPRIKVEVSQDIEDLAKKKLSDYQVVVQNYCNWHDPKGLSEQARAAFAQFLKDGGGLVVVHFANGAFHFSLPKAEESDWPEYRKIVRRVWNHKGKSGHDAFGRFTVDVTEAKHPITQGLKPFEITDELYFRQEGDEAIEPLISARSKITKEEEPLAWAYTYGKGRVFQTLLGHSEKTYDAFEAREMIRRAVAWAAGREVRPMDPARDVAAAPKVTAPVTDGRFDKALDARAGGVLAAGKPEYRQPPFTVQCWARLLDKQNYNILIAHEPKASATHWELFTMNGTGKLTAYLPGMEPDHVPTDVDICDSQWHYLAMVYEPERVRLFVDRKQVAEQAVKSRGGATQAGALSFGMLESGGLGCNGMIDEVCLSKGVREVKGLPDTPFSADEQTIGLWHFDKLDKDQFEDASKLQNPARLAGAKPPNPQGPTPPEGANNLPADPKLKTILIDRSAGDAYLGVKVDSQGRLFVSAREAVYVFEPNSRGGFEPRQEICRFPADSIIIGLELRGNDLYVLTANALYLLPEGRIQRSGLKPKRLVWGLPLDLYVSFHCLAWGPAGDLYLTHGDPLLNASDFNRPDHWGHWTLYTQPEGTKVPYTGVGSVLRVRPDGSGLQVVAGGLRGPVGLAFDRHWNLFSNDNDHESRADLYAPCRLLHVTPQVDFAWPRGWMASKSPDRADLLEPMTSKLGRGVPCDLAYYDEPYLPQEYRNCLLMDRWDQFTVNRYPLQRRGSSFSTAEQPFVNGRNLARPVGVTVGRDGRVFATVLYLGGNVWSPHCVSDLLMITRADDPPEHPFQAFDIATASADKLCSELSSPAWERRLRAHTEILRRGGPLLDEATKRLAAAKEDDPALFHLPWLAGAGGSEKARGLIAALAKHARPELRLQAVRILTEFPVLKAPRQLLVDALADADPQVQLAALRYFFKGAAELPLEPVVKLAGSSDSYLRQTAAKLLARRAALADLAGMAKAADAETRLAGVLAAGFRLTVPPSDYVPPQQVPLTYTHGNAQFTLRFADSDRPVDLRALARTGSYTTAQWWQALAPSPAHQELFDLLLRALEDKDERVQLQAAYFLALLRDPRSEPLVARVRLAIQAKSLAGAARHGVDKLWLVGPFTDGDQGFQNVHPPEQGAIDLSAEYAAKCVWQETASKEGRFALPAQERSSCYLYFQMQSSTRQTALLLLGGAGAVKVWHNGRPVWEGAASNVPLDIQPGSNDLLVRTATREGGRSLELHYRAHQQLLAVLPEKLDSATLTQRLKEGGKGGEQIAAEFLSIDWTQEVRKGDAAQGRKLFGTLGCAKCHAIAADQKGGGAPSLADARRRFTVPFVVESILLPSKQVAEPFRATLLALNNGQVVTGLVVGETADSLELLLADASRRTIRKKEIEERTLTNQSPMPAGLVKKPEELRDLLAYLLSENPLPP